MTSKRLTITLPEKAERALRKMCRDNYDMPVSRMLAMLVYEKAAGPQTTKRKGPAMLEVNEDDPRIQQEFDRLGGNAGTMAFVEYWDLRNRFKPDADFIRVHRAKPLSLEDARLHGCNDLKAYYGVDD
jgi:hypothetical protein